MPYEYHPVFEMPYADETVLFRYMDFSKFISLLKLKSLFFVRLSSLKELDPWEGSYPQKELDHRLKEFYSTRINRDETCTIQEVKDHAKGWKSNFEGKKESNFVNCWNIDKSESHALWRIYSVDRQGVAIKTSFKRFKDSLVNYDEAVRIGEVKYMDYYNDVFMDKFKPDNRNFLAFNLFLGLLSKRNVFKFERECRAMISIEDEMKLKNISNENGFYVPINLNDLIDEIYVSPNSSKWFKNLVVEIVKDYGINKEVKHSVIDNPPTEFNFEYFNDNI